MMLMSVNCCFDIFPAQTKPHKQKLQRRAAKGSTDIRKAIQSLAKSMT